MRPKYLLALALIIINTVSGTIATAAPITLKDINDQYYAGNFLANCLRQKNDPGPVLIPIEDAQDPSKLLAGTTNWGNETTVTIGRYLVTDDGRGKCKDGNLISRALTIMGYQSGEEFLTKNGYQRSVEYVCNNTPNQNPIRTSCPETQVYKTTSPSDAEVMSRTPSQSGAAKYYAWRQILFSQCNATEGLASNSGATYEKLVVLPDGSDTKYGLETVDIKFEDDNGDRKNIENFDYDGLSTTCGELLNDMNSLAPQFLTYANDNPSEQGLESISSGDVYNPDQTCAAGALGWLLCPLMTLMGDVMGSVARIIGQFMEFDPLITSSPNDMSQPGNVIRSIWQKLVGIANLLLVIAFLIVIFSQATSIGLSAYGIKKMLPRIVAAAILINISFYVCALLVDISNVIGASIGGVISGVISSIPNGGLAADYSSWEFAGAVGVTIGILTGATAIAAFTGAIAFLLPVVVSGLASILLVFLVLAIRHIMAILLIIISPLAFAAMILPNTADLFKKWWKALVTVLLLYPIIMVLAHGSLLVSKIILVTGSPEDDAMRIITIALAFIVMVAWIWALKFIITWGSGVIGKVAGMVNDRNKGLIDRSKNWAKEKQDRSGWSQGRQLSKNAGNTAAQRRAIDRINGPNNKSIFGRVSKMGAYGVSGLWGDKGLTAYGQQSGEILSAQASEAADKIHAQSVAYEKQNIASRYNPSDSQHRVAMANEAAQALRSGDQVKYDAIMSNAATVGADEFSHVYTQVQSSLRASDPNVFRLDSNGNPESKTAQMMRDGNKFISAQHGAELGQKNRGLSSMLQTEEDMGQDIKDYMINNEGVQEYYRKMKPENIAQWSSDTARAGAQFISDDILNETLDNEQILAKLSPTARKALENERTRRGAGGHQTERRNPAVRTADIDGIDYTRTD